MRLLRTRTAPHSDTLSGAAVFLTARGGTVYNSARLTPARMRLSSADLYKYLLRLIPYAGSGFAGFVVAYIIVRASDILFSADSAGVMVLAALAGIILHYHISRAWVFPDSPLTWRSGFMPFAAVSAAGVLFVLFPFMLATYAASPSSYALLAVLSVLATFIVSSRYIFRV